MARTTARPKAPPGPAPSLVRRVLGWLASIASLLGALGGGLVVGGGALYIWVPDLRPFALGVVLAGVGLLVLGAVAAFPAVKSAVTGRRGRLTLNALVLFALVTTILALLGFISFRNAQRVDTTATKQFTLAPQTIKVLRELPEPVRAVAFFVPTRADQARDRQRADDLLFEFARRSDKKFTYQFVDPEAEPSKARQMGVNQYPAVVFEAQESKRRHTVLIPPVTEQDFTSALLIVTGTQQKVVYFLTGHNERDITDVQENSQGFGFAARGLINDNYRIQPLNLSQAGRVPEDAAVLVVAGPKRDLLETERDILLNWLKGGGRALFLLDPDTPQTFKDLLRRWGVVLGEGTVVDQGSSVTGDPRTPVVQRVQYLDHTITNPLDVTFYPLATPVDILADYKRDPRKKPPWVDYTPLVSTSPRSWVTTDKERNEFLEGKDTPGPVVLGLVVEALAPVDEEPQRPSPREEQPMTSIVVVGDSDFATNKYYYAYTNSDLFLNAVNWLAKDYALISIRPKPVAFRELVMTRREFNFIRYSSWFLLPAAVAFLALIVWWRHR
ncbi:MAG: GldG family protein [Dehalococcoidia bacterium]|nr:GldG family protein [Dehalococcoidia bacterium]MDW8120182.1 GldG family protein [Chloroflexota bacterium]